MPNPTETLKPCPFCGGQADVQSESCGWRVVCVEIDCYTCGPWPDDCTEAEAITAWNTRLDPERERLRDLLRRLEPHLDAIVCYASTMGEHEPNRIAHDVRATLNSEVSHGRE